jgi:cellobiose-specific phosphotransferase system component IIA
MSTANSQPSFGDARKRVIDALAKKPETKVEWEKLISAAEDLLKTAGAV